jgi:hypothetical protein
MNELVSLRKFALSGVYQPLLLAVAERLNLSFSLHGTATAVELFHIHYLRRFVHPRVSSALTFPMLFNAMFHVFSVSSVVAAVFTKKNVNVIRHSSSTHS